MTQRNRLEWAADMVEIQQLAYRYAVCADSKDPEGIASLYAEREDNGVRITRASILERFTKAFSHSAMSILNVGNHLVDMDPGDPDRARGTVYCRGEIEWGEKWLIQQICYFDEYVREDGKWLFWSRKHLLFYGAGLGESPIGLPPSDAAELTDGKGSVPQAWASYRHYFEKHPDKKHY